MRYRRINARRVAAWVTFVAAANLMMAWAAAQNNQCDTQSGGSCEPFCEPEYYSQYGQYGTQYGARFYDRAKSRCDADGHCAPNLATWGYYQQKWRRWPTAAVGAEPTGPSEKPTLPPYDPPLMEQEDQRIPGMAAPMILPKEQKVLEEGEEPEDVTVPDVPLPESPLPGQPPAPKTQSSVMPGGNGPPPLPASLGNLRRRAAQKVSTIVTSPRTVASGSLRVDRLPTLNNTLTRQNAYPVQSASAVIAADGRAQSTNSTVEQAIHLAPVGHE